MELEFPWQIFKSNFMNIRPAGAELFHTDGRTDRSGERGGHWPLLTVHSSVKDSCHTLSNRAGFKWNILYITIIILIIIKSIICYFPQSRLLLALPPQAAPGFPLLRQKGSTDWRQDPLGSNGCSMSTKLSVSTLGTRALYLRAPYTVHRSTPNTENNFTASADNTACNTFQIHFNITPLLPVEIKVDSALQVSHQTLTFSSSRGTHRLFLAFPFRAP
jgi:hypothetical protein